MLNISLIPVPIRLYFLEIKEDDPDISSKWDTMTSAQRASHTCKMNGYYGEDDYVNTEDLTVAKVEELLHEYSHPLFQNTYAMLTQDQRQSYVDLLNRNKALLRSSTDFGSIDAKTMSIYLYHRRRLMRGDPYNGPKEIGDFLDEAIKINPIRIRVSSER
jgi:hypothetical protein